MVLKKETLEQLKRLGKSKGTELRSADIDSTLSSGYDTYQREAYKIIGTEITDNSIDSKGVTLIKFWHKEFQGKYYIIIEHNGEAMSLEELVNNYSLISNSSKKEDSTKHGKHGWGSKILMVLKYDGERADTKSWIVNVNDKVKSDIIPDLEDLQEAKKYISNRTVISFWNKENDNWVQKEKLTNEKNIPLKGLDNWFDNGVRYVMEFSDKPGKQIYKQSKNKLREAIKTIYRPLLLDPDNNIQIEIDGESVKADEDIIKCDPEYDRALKIQNMNTRFVYYETSDKPMGSSETVREAYLENYGYGSIVKGGKIINSLWNESQSSFGEAFTHSLTKDSANRLYCLVYLDDDDGTSKDDFIDASKEKLNTRDVRVKSWLRKVISEVKENYKERYGKKEESSKDEDESLSEFTMQGFMNDALEMGMFEHFGVSSDLLDAERNRGMAWQTQARADEVRDPENEMLTDDVNTGFDGCRATKENGRIPTDRPKPKEPRTRGPDEGIQPPTGYIPGGCPTVEGLPGRATREPTNNAPSMRFVNKITPINELTEVAEDGVTKVDKKSVGGGILMWETNEIGCTGDKAGMVNISVNKKSEGWKNAENERERLLIQRRAWATESLRLVMEAHNLVANPWDIQTYITEYAEKC